MPSFYFISNHLFIFGCTMSGMWDLSSPTKEWTYVLYPGSSESLPLNSQGSPSSFCSKSPVFLSFSRILQRRKRGMMLVFSQILLRSFFFKLYKNELTPKQLSYYCLLLTRCKSVEVSLKLFRTPFFAGLCLGAGTE